MSLKNKRKLKYSLAINEAIHQMMESDESVFLIGQGVKSPWYVGNTARGLLEKFGAERVIDTPVSENAITGAAIGAAIAGMRPIVVHPRVDFMMYALDPIINEAAKAKEEYEKKFSRRIERVILAGGGANLIGINEYVEKQINLPIITANAFLKVFYPKELELLVKELGPEFSVAIGLGIKK